MILLPEVLIPASHELQTTTRLSWFAISRLTPSKSCNLEVITKREACHLSLLEKHARMRVQQQGLGPGQAEGAGVKALDVGQEAPKAGVDGVPAVSLGRVVQVCVPALQRRRRAQVDALNRAGPEATQTCSNKLTFPPLISASA